jgi:hypothetical protein
MDAFADEELDIGVRVSLRDHFSNAAGKVAVAWKSLSARLGQTIVVPGLRAAVYGADAARRAFGALDRGVRSFTGFMPSFGMGLAAVAFGLHQLIGRTITSGSEIENLQLAFTTMLGSADAARAHLEELQRFAIGKPFEFSQLATASRTLQTYGFAARDVTGLLRDMGDAAFNANTGFTGVERMVRVFGQIRATGQATRGHLNMLVASGVDAYAILREQLHLTGDQLKNIARSGIPAERIITALRTGMQARYGGGMERAAATLTAKLSDLQDVFGRIYRDLYATLGPKLVYFIDMLSTGLTTNAEGIAGVLGSVVSTVLYAARIVTGVLGGAFGDVRARWERDAGGSLRSVTNQLQRFALVVEGVAMLVSSDNGRGLARIPRELQENLVRRGLWRSTVEFSRFFGRVRAFLGGFVEGFSKGLTTARQALDRVTDALGVSRLAMNTTRGSAATLGERVGKLVVALFALRYALVAVRVAGAALGAGGKGVGSLLQFALANPVLAAVAVGMIAVGAAAAYAYTHAEQLSSTAPKWQALRSALDLLAGPLVEVAIFAARAETIMESWRKRTSGAGKELRAVWETAKGAALSFVDRVAGVASAIAQPFRVAWAFVSVAAYVAFAKVVQFLAPFAARVRAFALGLVAPLVLAVVGLVVRLRSMARDTFAPFLHAARTVWTHVRDAITQRAFEAYAKLRLRTVGFVAVLLQVWRGLKTGLTSMFDGLVQRILAPFRDLARELVAMYRGLPAALQVPGMAGSVATLEAFAAGGQTSTPSVPPEQGGARVDTAAAGGGSIAATNIAHTNFIASAARAGAAVAPAPVVNITPPPTILHLDGREVARTQQRYNTREALRGGEAVRTDE